MIDDPRLTPDDPAYGGGRSTPNAPTGTPYTQDDLNNARQFYADFIQQHGLSSWGDPSDAVRFYQSAREKGQSHDDALQSALGALGWNDSAKWPQPATSTTPTKGSLGSYAGNTGLTAPFTGTFTSPTPNALPSAPGFNGPAFPTLPKWTPTDATDFENDPQYLWNRNQGITGEQQSAAANGLLNSGGTLKDIAQWTSNYANNYFNDVDTRRRNDYATDIQTQYLLPWQAAYQMSKDQLGANQLGYSTTAAATQRANELDYSNAWNRFLFGYDVFRDQRDSTFDKAYKLATS